MEFTFRRIIVFYNRTYRLHVYVCMFCCLWLDASRQYYRQNYGVYHTCIECVGICMLGLHIHINSEFTCCCYRKYSRSIRQCIHSHQTYVLYAVSLIPFILVNGILTGAFQSEPVVWYNTVNFLIFVLFLFL